MPTPWDGKLTPINDTNPFATAMSPPKTVSNNIVSRVKTAMFKRADELKQFIDNPTAFEGGRKWSLAEKNELKQAEADYKEIQSKKKALDGIDSLFDEKSRKSTKLSEDARNIESKLNEIDNHLSQYEEKLKLLEEKGDNKTEEEIAWEIEAYKKISKLMSEKTGLSSSLTEIQSLQLNLNDAEKTITKELEKLLSGGGPEPKGPSGPQSAEAVNREMAEIKGDVFSLGASINIICAAASDLFSNLFESIKNISSKIASQFKSANATLAESSVLLSNYPAPTMQMRM